jgi:hypothetical protein
MASTIVGVLLECHRDHIILSNGTQIFLDGGVTVDSLPVGATLTILCTAQGDRKLAHYIRVDPDWVFDSLEALAGGADSSVASPDRAQRRSARAVSARSRTPRSPIT